MYLVSFIIRIYHDARSPELQIHTHIHTKTVHFMVLKAVNTSRMCTPNTEMYRIILLYEVILFTKRIHTVEFTVNKILICVTYDFKLNYVI